MIKQKWNYIVAFLLYILVLTFTILGFVYEKTNLKVERVEIQFDNLPKTFNNFKIVQISDIHLGSFQSTKTVEKSVEMINSLNPDIVIFSGDMINVSSSEVNPYMNILSKIKARYGKYSVLGNHDIGDYFSLRKPINQNEITTQLILDEQKMGFIMLIDSSCYIKIGNDSIALIGINNCGNYPFLHSGNLQKAIKNTNYYDFKILVSHDPDEWNSEVLNQTNINLTLSGHTHAMQMAIICKLFKMSPAALKYSEWYGLYSSDNQKIYVNPGMSYSGFSGRIGTRPEITCITLKSKK
ncbi:MAG: metallophosphoesterase [Bacteroidota bacterium]